VSVFSVEFGSQEALHGFFDEFARWEEEVMADLDDEDDDDLADDEDCAA
jgi:hypothetical protein